MSLHTNAVPPQRPARISAAAWYDRRWTRRRRMTVPGTIIPGDLEGFPLLVDLSNDPDVVRHARSDGRDIVFTAADGMTVLPSERVVHQKILSAQGVWTIWSAPRAVRHAGRFDRTYVAYYTRNAGWWISAFDHHGKAWQHVQLRSHDASAHGRWWDDHNNPAITVRLDGRLVVVYGEHSTERSWCRISEHPEDITSWSEEIPFQQEQRSHPEPGWWRGAASRLAPRLFPPRRRDPAYSYVNLYTLPDGTLWRQYRPLTTWSGQSRRPTFVMSRDGGQTWGDPVRFIEQQTRTPYLVTAQRGNRIHFVFTDAHPDEWEETSVYHAYYDHADGTFRRSDGTTICDLSSLPFTPRDATRIFDGTTSAGEGWVHDVQADGRGNVAALFNVYAGELVGRPSYRLHEYWYAYSHGGRWTTHRIASEQDNFCSGQRRYSGGFVIDPEDLATVYVSLVDPGVSGNSHSRHVWRYETPDEGRSWTRTQVSRPGQGKAHSRPVVPINRHPDLPVIWLYGHYVNYLEYHTALVTGDHGDLLDSQHYVKVPRLAPGEDLVLYAYYDAPEAVAPADGVGRVWPPQTLLAYRGTLTQNDLRMPVPEAAARLTVEMIAVWASNRKGRGPLAILSDGSEASAVLFIGKTGDQHLVTQVSTGTECRRQVYPDLSIPTRNWKHAADPAKKAVVQVRVVSGKGVFAWLNGTKSAAVGEVPGPLASSRTALQTLRVGYGSDAWEDRFQGWVEVLRIYERDLPDEWLAMSFLAESDNGAVVRVGPPEPLDRSVQGQYSR